MIFLTIIAVEYKQQQDKVVVINIIVIVAGDDPNKQTRNETSRGVSQQVRLGTILRVSKTRKPRKTKGDG